MRAPGSWHTSQGHSKVSEVPRAALAPNRCLRRSSFVITPIGFPESRLQPLRLLPHTHTKKPNREDLRLRSVEGVGGVGGGGGVGEYNGPLRMRFNAVRVPFWAIPGYRCEWGSFPAPGRPRVVKAVGDPLGQGSPRTFLELCSGLCFLFASQLPTRVDGVEVNPPALESRGLPA